MPKQGNNSGKQNELNVQKRTSKQSILPKATRSEITDLVGEMLRQYHNSSSLQDRVRDISSEAPSGISTQEAREVAGGEIRAYHRSNILSGKIEEEFRTRINDFLEKQEPQTGKESGPSSNNMSPEEIRKMLLSAFDQYHRSPQLEKRIRKVTGDSTGITRKEVEKEILANLKNYHRSEQLRNKIQDISAVPPAEGGSHLSVDEITDLIREETEATLRGEVLEKEIKLHSQKLVEGVVEKEMGYLLDTPDVEQRIRDICRSLADETSINLPVVVPGDLRNMVQEEIDADHIKHPIQEGAPADPEELRALAQEIAQKEVNKLLHSTDLTAMMQSQAKKAAEKAVAPLPALTREDVVRIAKEVVGRIPSPTPAQPIEEQARELVREAFESEDLPEEFMEEVPHRRRRVRRKYRR